MIATSVLLCRSGTKWYNGSCTSFMCCFQMNHRKEPKAHSHLDLDLPRRRWRARLLDSMQLRDWRDNKGNQTGEAHNQGWAKRAWPEWRDWN